MLENRWLWRSYGINLSEEIRKISWNFKQVRTEFNKMRDEKFYFENIMHETWMIFCPDYINGTWLELTNFSQSPIVANPQMNPENTEICYPRQQLSIGFPASLIDSVYWPQKLELRSNPPLRNFYLFFFFFILTIWIIHSKAT